MFLAIGGTQPKAHQIIAGFDVDRLVTAMNFDRRHGARPRVEQALEIGLCAHVGIGPTRQTGRTATKAQERFTGSIAPFVEIRRLAETWDVVTEAASLQDAGDLVIEVNR